MLQGLFTWNKLMLFAERNLTRKIANKLLAFSSIILLPEDLSHVLASVCFMTLCVISSKLTCYILKPTVAISVSKSVVLAKEQLLPLQDCYRIYYITCWRTMQTVIRTLLRMRFASHDREITVEQALILAKNQGFKSKLATT